MHYEQLRAGVIQHDLLVDNLIYKVLLCFSRDTAILEHFKYNSATPPKSFLHGEITKASLMSFRYHMRVEVQGIVSLCLQFERLLQTHLPQLFYHLRQIGAQP
ncbi:hypothetical protein GOODEAATRI_005042 [Goodea atripinnis]|uniref:Uncharacterized protein n=1 Tax=Goodea atripinnis TaxID=208336 RepID=A0ABV0NRZ2_9TELE